jgi:hypothetical protein
MGEVWTCRDRELRRDVAVKFLALDDAVTPDLARGSIVRRSRPRRSITRTWSPCTIAVSTTTISFW